MPNTLANKDKAGGFASYFLGDPDIESLLTFPVAAGEPDPRISDWNRMFAACVDAEANDKESGIPAAVFGRLAEAGLWGMKIPGKYGGLDLPQMDFNRVTAQLSTHCLSTAISLSASQCIGATQFILDYGTDAQKERILPLAAKGAITAFALTEREAGSDPSRIQTFATEREDGSFELTGEKIWSTNGMIADYIVVVAREWPIPGKKPVFTSFLVEKGCPGLTFPHRCGFMGLKGVFIGVMNLSRVIIPKENVIGPRGDGLRQALEILNGGRVTLNSGSLGLCARSLQLAREYAGNRVQWGAPIGKIPAVTARLGEIAYLTFAVESVTWYAAAALQSKHPDLRLISAISKWFCAEAGWKVADLTLQLYGGKGYESEDSLRRRGESPTSVERIFRDARILRIIEGTSEIMLMFLCRDGLGSALKVLAQDEPRIPGSSGTEGPGVDDFRPNLPEEVRTCLTYVRVTARRLGERVAALADASAADSSPDSELDKIRLTRIGANLHVLMMAASYSGWTAAASDAETDLRNGLLDSFRIAIGLENDALFADESRKLGAASLRIGNAILSGSYRPLQD